VNQVVVNPPAKVNLLDFDRQGLRDFFTQIGEKPYRAEQVMKWIYHDLEDDFENMTDVGKALRAKLTEVCYIGAPKTMLDKAANDGTHKWLLGMDSGNAVETVYIPEPTRGTLCVSSQIGCALNCQFCSTGAQGFNRNLSTAEIIGQVWVAAKYLGNVTHQNRRITNVVMMGMGEPLANFENVVKAMSLMRDDLGFGLAAKRVTLVHRRHGAVDRPAVGCDRRVAGRVAACGQRRSAHRAGAAQQALSDCRSASRLPALGCAQAAHLDHVRIHLDEGRQRPARARAPVDQADAQAADLQGQPDSVQSFPGHPFRAFRRERHPRFPDAAAECRAC
jgi:hypothetical protein